MILSLFDSPPGPPRVLFEFRGEVILFRGLILPFQSVESESLQSLSAVLIPEDESVQNKHVNS